MILSLDLSTAETGFAIIDYDKNILLSGMIRDSNKNKYTRLNNMKNKIALLIDKYNLKEIVLEEIQLQGNYRSFKALAELRGTICTMLIDKGIKERNIHSYTATEWRKVHKIKQGRGVKREEIKAEIWNRFSNLKEDLFIDELEAILLGLAHVELRG